ncbi:MAG: cysteine desulfurase family protein [Alphaproteobacteria bacterium]
MQHYLDHHATTPLAPEVAAIMQPLWTEAFGNPASLEHAQGLAAADRVDVARQQVAAALGAEAREIVFTSGATEANNMAVLGAARFRKAHEGRDRVLVFETEHSCVLGAARALTDEGFDVAELPVLPDGTADLAALEAALDERVALVCLMLANNEVGTIQPLKAAADLAHAVGAWVHTDAAQAVGKIPVNVRELDVDLLSLSGHKIYGPMGVGALFVRRRPRVRLTPLVHGGGQERGLRAGTLPMPLIAGLGAAVALADARRETEAARFRELAAKLIIAVEATGLAFQLNGHPENRLPGNVSLSFPDIPREALFAAMADAGVAVSSGSACSSHDVAPSHVLTAMRVEAKLAQQTLRVGLGRSSTEGDTDALVAAIQAAAERSR